MGPPLSKRLVCHEVYSRCCAVHHYRLKIGPLASRCSCRGPSAGSFYFYFYSHHMSCRGTWLQRQQRDPLAHAPTSTAHRSYTRFDDSERHGQSEHFTAKIEVASQLRDKVLEVPCGATRRVSRAFGHGPHRRISATKSAGSGILYRHFEWWL